MSTPSLPSLSGRVPASVHVAAKASRATNRLAAHERGEHAENPSGACSACCPTRVRVGGRPYGVMPDGWAPSLGAWVLRDHEGHLVTIPARDDR